MNSTRFLTSLGAAGIGRLGLCLMLALALLASCMAWPAPAAAAEPSGPPVTAAVGDESEAVCPVDLAVDPTAVIRTAPLPASSSDDIPLPLGGVEVLAFLGMVALVKDRNTPARDGKVIAYPVAGGATIYAGALVVANGGYAEPGTTALNLVALGRANEQVDNSAGADGDADVLVERGVFLFANDGSITAANIGADAYIVDDQTVAATDGAGTRSKAGVIRGVETGGVWVEI